MGTRRLHTHGFFHGSTRALYLVLGETLWSHPSSFGGNVSVLSPLLQVPDIDADGVPDLLVITQEENQVELSFQPLASPAAPSSGACRPSGHFWAPQEWQRVCFPLVPWAQL